MPVCAVSDRRCACGAQDEEKEGDPDREPRPPRHTYYCQVQPDARRLDRRRASRSPVRMRHIGSIYSHSIRSEASIRLYRNGSQAELTSQDPYARPRGQRRVCYLLIYGRARGLISSSSSPNECTRRMTGGPRGGPRRNLAFGRCGGGRVPSCSGRPSCPS